MRNPNNKTYHSYLLTAHNRNYNCTNLFWFANKKYIVVHLWDHIKILVGDSQTSIWRRFPAVATCLKEVGSCQWEGTALQGAGWCCGGLCLLTVRSNGPLTRSCGKRDYPPTPGGFLVFCLWATPWGNSWVPHPCDIIHMLDPVTLSGPQVYICAPTVWHLHIRPRSGHPPAPLALRFLEKENPWA